MNPFPQLEPNVERMVDGLIGHVWPGGHRSPPILDPTATELQKRIDHFGMMKQIKYREAVDFAWVNGRAVPLTNEGGEP